MLGRHLQEIAPRVRNEFARIERLCAFRDVGQQNIHKRMLAVERRPALVLAVRNSPNRRDIEFAEGVCIAREEDFAAFDRALADRPNYP